MKTDEVLDIEVRPWVRYWARIIDIIIFASFFPFFIAFVLSPIVYIDLMKQQYFFVLIMLFLYIFFEALLLSTWGTTFGKALLKVKLKNKDQSKLSYFQALKRTFLLTLKGMGFSVPIVGFITLAVAYGKLVDKHETSWDRDGGHQIRHQKIGILRILIAFIPFIIILFGLFMPTIGIDYKLSKLSKRENINLPRMVDPLTRMESVTYMNKRFIRYFSVLDENVTKSQINALAPILKQGNCKEPSIQYFIKRGVRFDFVYSLHNGRDKVTFTVVDCDGN